jgi:transcriptional regulator with XRE-family HTH domain
MSEVKTLREWREARFVTQGEIARAIGVSESSVRNWENYGRRPHLRSVRELAKFFGIEPGQLTFVASGSPKLTAA